MRGAARSSFAALFVLSALACKKPVARQEPVHADIDDDAGSNKSVAAPMSPFAVVATDDADFKLCRAAMGPVLGFQSFGTSYELSADGSLAPIDPLVTLGAETFGQGWTVGRVTGVWPNSIFIETANAAGRAGTLQKNVRFDAESGVAAVTPLTGRHIAAAWPCSSSSARFLSSRRGFPSDGKGDDENVAIHRDRASCPDSTVGGGRRHRLADGALARS
jgi:hypothetical protein